MTISNEAKLGYNELNAKIANATAEILSGGDSKSPEDVLDALASANVFNIQDVDQEAYISGYVENTINLMQTNPDLGDYPFTPEGYDQIMSDLYEYHKENGLDIETMNVRLGLAELVEQCGLATKQRIKDLNVRKTMEDFEIDPDIRAVLEEHAREAISKITSSK